MRSLSRLPNALVALAAMCALPSYGLHAAPAGALDLWKAYEQRTTWQATMLATRENLRKLRDSLGPLAKPLPDFGTSSYTVAAWIRTTKGGSIFSVSSADGVWAQRGGKSFFVRGGKLGFDAAYENLADACLHRVDTFDPFAPAPRTASRIIPGRACSTWVSA